MLYVKYNSSMREISRAARPLRYALATGSYRAGTSRLKRADAGGPPPPLKGSFCVWLLPLFLAAAKGICGKLP